MPSFLQNIADKAQNALNSSSLGPQIQQYTGKLSPGSDAPPGQQASTTPTSSAKSYALENVQHQLRLLQQQYSSNTSPLQRNITSQKGVAIDLEGLGRDIKVQSKEMYLWGQSEKDDIKDVADRLAYLNFVQGTLAINLSKKLDSSRSSLKSIRDGEAALVPRRNVREGIRQQINRIKSEGQRGAAIDQKIAELEQYLKKVSSGDEDGEKQFEILKRKAIRESEEAKWSAIREYAEKLILLADASNSFLDALPAVPPTAENPYGGAKATAATRASVQANLNKWVTGNMKIPESSTNNEGAEADTRSFGETHASELSAINSTESPNEGASTSPSSQPIDPNQLNQTPIQINSGKVLTSSPPTSFVSLTTSQSSVPSTSPTVAETGIPLTSGTTGPGPNRGSLSPQNKAPAYGSPEAIASAMPSYPSAEEEKKRLAREERERMLGTGGSSALAPQYESAEEAKKRLERAERERVLQLGGAGSTSGSGPKSGMPHGDPNDGPPPPAYHD